MVAGPNCEKKINISKSIAGTIPKTDLNLYNYKIKLYRATFINALYESLRKERNQVIVEDFNKRLLREVVYRSAIISQANILFLEYNSKDRLCLETELNGNKTLSYLRYDGKNIEKIKIVLERSNLVSIVEEVLK